MDKETNKIYKSNVNTVKQNKLLKHLNWLICNKITLSVDMMDWFAEYGE